jgi:hypothetical protein
MKCIIIITIILSRQLYSSLMSQSPSGALMLCVLRLVTQGSPKTALKYFWGKILLGCWGIVRLENFEDFFAARVVLSRELLDNLNNQLRFNVLDLLRTFGSPALNLVVILIETGHGPG